MEKEDSTVQQTVGSPAPENVKEVDAPEREHHNVDTPTNEELPDDEIVGTSTKEGQEEALHVQKQDQNFDKEGHDLNDHPGNTENEDSVQSSEMIIVEDKSIVEMEAETHDVQKEAIDEASLQMKYKDISSREVEGEKMGHEMKDHQGNTENSVPEETVEMKKNLEDILYEEEDEHVSDGTEEPEAEVNAGSAWPTSALSNFVKAKSLVAISNVFCRLSGRVEEGQNCSVEEDKEINSSKKNAKEESLESSETVAMKGRIILYTKLGCQECKEARLFLRKKRLGYFEINIDVYPSRKLELEKLAGSSAVPRVFFNEVLVGGLNELKDLDESGKLEEKIDSLTTDAPSFGAPQPPFSGEDDVSSSGGIDELAVLVRKMKESIVVKDRFYKFRRVANCFVGSEAVDFLSEDQYLEREEAIEFARKLSRQLFFQHVLEENVFEDGNHLYRFLDQDPVISQCQNIPRGIIESRRKSFVEISSRLRVLLYAILEAYASDDGKHVDYRTIHGSEEFARYLRIVEGLQRVDLNKTATEERLAFFINLYNLMAIHAILVWGHPEGALDRRRLLNDFKYVIGGCTYSLSEIQDGILRSNQRPPYTLIKPFGVTDKRFKVALPYPEPLIHFALVCGNRSGPALRCYSPRNIDTELMEAACDFLRSGALILDLDAKTVSVTKILQWYSVDFGKSEVEVLKHAANYLETEQSQTLLDLLDSTQQLKVVYQPYDWGLNS